MRRHPHLRRSGCVEHHVRQLASCRLIGEVTSVFPWSKPEASAEQYGSLLNAVISRMVASTKAAGPSLECALERGDVGEMRNAVRRAWREAEQWEKQLRSVRPPAALKRFHRPFLRGIRALILGHGSMASLAAGTARWWYGLADELLDEASAEMRLSKGRDGGLYSSLELTAEAEWLLVED